MLTMMAAARLTWICSACLLLLAFLSQVAGQEVVTCDLQVQTVTRTLDIESMEITVTVNFTCSTRPQTRWTYAGKRGETAYVTDTQLKYDGNQGQAIATFPFKIKMVTLEIGHFDTHYLDLFIRRDYGDDMTQTLNTALSSVQPGYDISYSPGDSFQVIASIPKHVAENFTWSRFMDNPEYDYDIRLDASYVDPNSESDRIMSTMHHLDRPLMSNFLQRRKIFGEEGVTFELNFTTTREKVNGYFRFLNMYHHTSYRNDDVDQLVVEIWETMFVEVHEASIPGPFPEHFVYVSSDYDTEDCPPGGRCSIYCDGYSNTIAQTLIFKVGATEPFGGSMHYHVRNSHHTSFHTHFHATGDYTGDYACEVVSSDGHRARTIIQVSEE